MSVTLSNRHKGIACLVASAFGFALMAMFVRLCDDCGGSVSCFQKSFFRNLVALAIALPVFLASRRAVTGRRPSVTHAGWRMLLLRSALGTAGIFANFYALSHISIAEGQTLNKTAPFFTVLFAWLFMGERPSRRQVVALVLAFLGVLLISKPGFAGAAAWPLALGLFGGLAAGGAYACVREMRRMGLAPELIVLVFSAFSCLAAVPFMLARFDAMTLRQVFVLFGAGAGAAIGQFGITAAYGFAPPCEISVYDYTNIVFTAMFGLALFGQVPDALSLVGMAVILLAAFRMNGKPA